MSMHSRDISRPGDVGGLKATLSAGRTEDGEGRVANATGTRARDTTLRC
jgi:hypothetical protein